MNKPFVTPPAPDEQQRQVPLWMLALFTFSGTVALHVFLPALPEAALDLGAGSGAMQLTVSLYIVGLAIGQLVYGPLSDRFGRRVTLITGLTLYTVAGLGAALAPQVKALIVARLFQALGGCAGLVLGRAIVRDASEPSEAARRLALMNLMVMIGPGAAPLIGSVLALTLGWRSIFVLLCGLGLTNLILAWRLLPETSARTGYSDTGTLARNYWRLLRSPAFLGYCVGGGCATTSMYAFIASTPFIVVDQLHRPVYEVGFLIALMIAGAWIGSMLSSRLIGKVAIERLLVRANMLSVVAAFAFLGVVLTGNMTPLLVTGTTFFFAVGAGMASPVALTEAISVNPHVIGSASGLYGFVQMVVGAVCTALAGIGGDPALASAVVLSAAGIIAQVSFWIALRPRGGRASD